MVLILRLASGPKAHTYIQPCSSQRSSRIPLLLPRLYCRKVIMPRMRSLLAFGALAQIALVAADFDSTFYATNSTKYYCNSKMGLSCPPPLVCSRDSLTKKTYCCRPGPVDSICWTAMDTKCDGGNGEPSGSQIPCSSGNNAFCCLKGR